MITRKQAQKVVDQCELISLLAKERRKQKGLVKQAEKMLNSSHQPPLGFNETCHYKGIQRQAAWFINLTTEGIKWANRGLSMLNGERKNSALPALIWDRSRYGNPSIVVVIDAVDAIKKKKQDK